MLKKEKFDVFLEYADKLLVHEQEATGLCQVIQKTLDSAVLHRRDLKFILVIELERPSGPLV